MEILILGMTTAAISGTAYLFMRKEARINDINRSIDDKQEKF